MEYVANGNLLHFLRDNRANQHQEYGANNMTSRSLTARDLTLFAFQIAAGMEYISSKDVSTDCPGNNDKMR